MKISFPLKALCVLSALTTVTQAATITIDFDDLDTATDPVLLTDQYASLGVTFTNAEAVDPATIPYPYLTGQSLPNVIADPETSGYIYPNDPIIAYFAMDVISVSIMALDFGDKGVILNAFDAADTLLDTDSAFGTGLGVGNTQTLSVSGNGIRRVEFSQYFTPVSGGDGTAFDNLSFTYEASVPESSIWFLLGSGLMGWGFFGIHRRKSARKRSTDC